jgi:GalNAc-alpha-(1->4)-GalNAc-alpha-(1->3)-diNAcBac-PP-undecaprenol alpha-1,4-N-acetyl-D-galactosaminyltransferase
MNEGLDAGSRTQAHADTSRKSVLLVVSSLAAGGAERVVSALADLWAAKGWRVTVLTFSAATHDHYKLHPNVRRIALDMVGNSTHLAEKLAGNLRRIAAVRDAVFESRPEAVVSFVDQTNVIVLAALFRARVPVIVSERTDASAYRPPVPWRAARFLLYRTAAGVVVQTAAAAAWAATLVPSQRVRTIPNFVRTLRIPHRRGAERVILAVGRLSKEKGFDLLLEAFALSRVFERGYRLVILGEGPERAALVDRARRLGILHALDMPGSQPAPEDWMERASVFVLSSRYEGFPNALLEAMAMGCAVIAANCSSGPREIIRDGHDGLIVPPENAPAIAEALKRVLGDDRLRLRLGESAIAVRERFGSDRVLQLWESAIVAATAE